ncbi:CsbD family protein [Sphaerimonospora mesophila]|uniref:CsbD family protein n=1 Tax=Sphaerimonospora mesophila TaxID=37483 RepID=UPI0006E3E1DC
MSTEDKFRNKAEEVGGMAKEGMGRATDDERLEARGRAEQSESKIKQAGEKVKDAAGKVKDAFTD